MIAAAQNEPTPDQKSEDQTPIGISEEDALKNLSGTVRDQSELERDITMQANAALMEAEDQKDRNRIVKLELTRDRLKGQLDKEKKRLEKAAGNPYQSRTIQNEVTKLEQDINQATLDITDFESRMQKRHQEDPLHNMSQTKSIRLPGESNREYLIRTGKITPFSKLGGSRPAGIEGQLADTLLDAEEEAAAEQLGNEAGEGPQSHQLLRRPGFAEEETPPPVPKTSAVEAEFSLRPRKKRKVERN